MELEKSKYKLLIIAPSGAHLRNFLERVEGATREILIITSKPLIFDTRHKVEFVDFSLRKLSNYWNTPNKIRECFEAFQPDVVHVHQLNSVSFFTFIALKKKKIPIVCTAWGTDVLLLPKKIFLMKRMVQYSLRSASFLSSDSAFMAEKMRELAYPKKIEIEICNFGVARPEISLPKENIIYSNRLHKPLYRIDKIILAFAKFSTSSEGKDWKLVIAATGTETENLKKIVSEKGLNDKVLFVGWLEPEANMEWYAKSKIWVSVPESDATAISLLEAMFHGCYPLVIDLPASHEWIKSEEQGRIISDVDSNFFVDISEIDFNKAASLNRGIVEREATFEISEVKFTSLHRKLIAKE